jgi:hypothetical protein
MDWLFVAMLLGIPLIDGKLWKMMKAQKDHHRKVETLLSEIRDRSGKTLASTHFE